MGRSDDERKRERDRQRRRDREREIAEMEKKQSRTRRESSRMSDSYDGTHGSYKKDRRRKHGREEHDLFTSPHSERSTREYQRNNREAELRDRARDIAMAEERNRMAHRSEYRSERKGGLDKEGYDRMADRTLEIASLDTDTARARRKSLYDKNDSKRSHESLEFPNQSSRNLHGRHARSAEREAGRSIERARGETYHASYPSTPSSRDRYSLIADDGGPARTRLPPRDDSRGLSPHSSRYSSPLSVNPRDHSSTSISSGRDSRVNLGPGPSRDYRPFVPPDDRHSDASSSMSGGSGRRHERNADNWRQLPTPSDPYDVADIARRIADIEIPDEAQPREVALRRARDGKRRADDGHHRRHSRSR